MAVAAWPFLILVCDCDDEGKTAEVDRNLTAFYPVCIPLSVGDSLLSVIRSGEDGSF